MPAEQHGYKPNLSAHTAVNEVDRLIKRGHTRIIDGDLADLLDELVWREVINLLEDPSLIQGELDRRLSVARDANPTKRREEVSRRELARVQKSMDRLMTAYQEDLLSLEDLRRRMPELRKREQATQAELSSLSTGLADRAGYLRLAETLTSFLERLREAAKTLDVLERHRIVRLLVKEVLVADDAIVIRHSIPVTNGVPGAGGTASAPSGRPPALGESYLLRKWGNLTDSGESVSALCFR
jgi:site-specific DNA recombinase